jgi:rhodanese-related sulfurtransferase
MNSMAMEIFPPEAFARSQQGALFVDVREKSELDAEAYDVPSLLHIPLGQLENRFNESPRDQDVVIVCHHGIRSLRAVHFLISLGFGKAVSMKLGMAGWINSGFPIKRHGTE